MGDAWHQKYTTETEGLTLAITRTKFAEDVLKNLATSNKIIYWPDSYQETNEVMNDPNIVTNFKLKRKIYGHKNLRPLMPVLVFFEQYIIYFPWRSAFKGVWVYLKIFK